MKSIHTPNAPEAIGPFSQGYIAGDFLYVSGQGALDPATRKTVAGGIEEQTKRVCENVLAVIKEAGADPKKIVKTTCFLADMADFARFNAVYKQYITNAPARSCVAVRQLPLPDLLCEIEAVVYLK